jgi:hypothetical protein
VTALDFVVQCNARGITESNKEKLKKMKADSKGIRETNAEKLNKMHAESAVYRKKSRCYSLVHLCYALSLDSGHWYTKNDLEIRLGL